MFSQLVVNGFISQQLTKDELLVLVITIFLVVLIFLIRKTYK